MTTHDNAAPQSDWTPVVGNTCAGCGGSANLCYVLDQCDGKPCCDGCSHTKAQRFTRPTVRPIASQVRDGLGDQ